MVQHLNLYTAAFKPQQHWLNSKNSIRAVLGVVLICGLIGGGLRWLSQRDASNSTEQAVLNQQQTTLTSLQEQVKQQREEVEAESGRLREVELALSRVKSTLQADMAGEKTTSYAAYFEALANQAQGNLWITALSVSADGQSIELKGRMLDAAALPDYLSRLNSERVFRGRRFEQLQMGPASVEGAEGNQSVTEFVLRSTPDSKELAR